MYLSDMQAAARVALRYLGAGSRRDLDENQMLADAVVRQLEILGEAASHVGVATRETNPAVPWRGLTGMRNVLIHAYHRVDMDEVWRTVTEDLPAVARAPRATPRALGIRTVGVSTLPVEVAIK